MEKKKLKKFTINCNNLLLSLSIKLININIKKMKKSKGNNSASHTFKKAPTKHKNKAVRSAALWGIKVGSNAEKRKNK